MIDIWMVYPQMVRQCCSIFAVSLNWTT